MKVENETTEDLTELAERLLGDITKISHDWHVRVPEFKAMLVRVENELYRREL